MPGFMSMLQKGVSYNRNTLIGMGAGAAAGAFSNDGSALQGAIAGAAFGRYGAGAYRAGKRGFMQGSLRGMSGITGATSGLQRMSIGMMRGMGAIGGQVRRDFNYLMRQGQLARRQIGARLRGNSDVRSQGLNSALYSNVRAARGGLQALDIDPTGASVGAVGLRGPASGGLRRATGSSHTYRGRAGGASAARTQALIQQQTLAMGRGMRR